jgi:hypothetical protein
MEQWSRRALEISLLPQYLITARGTSFNINQYPIKLMEGFMTDSRNVIVIKRSFDQFSVKKTNMRLLKMYFISPENQLLLFYL